MGGLSVQGETMATKMTGGSTIAPLAVLPETAPGRWALGAAGGAGLCFALALLAVATGQRGGDTPFANLYLAIPMLAAAALALAGGGLSMFALAARRDRSIVLLIPLFAGLFVLGNAIGEIAFPH